MSVTNNFGALYIFDHLNNISNWTCVNTVEGLRPQYIMNGKKQLQNSLKY